MRGARTAVGRRKLEPVAIVRVSAALLLVMLNRSKKPRMRMLWPRLNARSTRRSRTVMLSCRRALAGSALRCWCSCVDGAGCGREA